MADNGNMFTCIKTEGSILPSDLLSKIASGHTDIEGLKETDYYLVEGEKLSENISRSWNRLQTLWDMFNTELAKMPDNDHAIGLTRSKWLLPLFQELGYGQLQRENVTVFDGKEYPISHFHDHSPIHLVGCGISIDKRTPGAAGASRISPHGLVQEFLNRSDDHLWAFVSNGFYLRILRDNVSLTRQAYVEFDLKAMMDGQVYSDFSLLWLLCHCSRIDVQDSKTPEDCWLEKWSKQAIKQGTRVMEDLRVGVEKAISILGSGFLADRNNNQLREKLRSGHLDKQDYYRQLLRIVYRMIFLFVAEDRDLLLLSDASKEIKETYAKYYSTGRLRNIAQKHKGTQHSDMYRGLQLIFSKLHKQGCPELGLPALGSFLWNPQFTQDISESDLTNRDLLEAIRALAYTVDNRSLRQIDYKNLGSEELGSVYESLLELHPQLHIDTAGFELSSASGHERKTTGSYYTPTSLITCLLDSALDPVIDAAAKKDNPEKAILNLKVCDPACGSGHFLVAAAHRIAKRLASVRCGEDEPSPNDTRKALRDVISHCIYGVDINLMSVELCKISLWLEAIEPGKPLSFIDHHIKCGNSLLGTTPALMEKGIPDEAFNPIEGDIKAICNDWKKQNKDERKGQETMFSLFAEDKEYLWDKLGTLSTTYNQIEEFNDNDITSREQKEKQYEQFVKSSSYEFGHLLADAWCSAFVIEKNKKFSYGITEKIYKEIEKNPHDLAPWLKEEIKRLAKEYQFFHWHLEFPSVFQVPAKGENVENEQTGLKGGFDCVLGNPPWEKIKLQEKEFFATRALEVATATKPSLRKDLIEKLKTENPKLHDEFLLAKRIAEGSNLFLRNSNNFPLGSRGDINTYLVFAELNYLIANIRGRIGCIVPSAIVTDNTAKFFFQTIMDNNSLNSAYDFENSSGLFPGVHRSQKFCLLTLVAKQKSSETTHADFVFFATEIQDLKDISRHFTMSSEELSLINPLSKTCPIFRFRHDAEIAKAIYRNIPILQNDNVGKDDKWNVRLFRMFDMTNDSALLREKENLIDSDARRDGILFRGIGNEVWYPIYEGKMIDMYDSRNASIVINPDNPGRPQQKFEHGLQEHNNPTFINEPFLWAPKSEIQRRLAEKWDKQWYLGIKRITASTNQRTFIGCILPYCAVSYTILSVMPEGAGENFTACLLSNFNSFAADYCVRQKTAQPALPAGCVLECAIIEPSRYCEGMPWNRNVLLNEWVIVRVLELSYNSYNLNSFAKDYGYNGPPFIWNEERRFKIRAELDAIYFHLYLGTEQEWKEKGSKELLEYFSTTRHAIEYIMETFPIVKRKDEAKYGSYRTKELILEVYDKMAEAIANGTEYQTILDPSPGPPTDSEGNFIPMSQWDPNNWPPHIHPPKEKISE